jgi:hypothetical protein
MFLSPADRTTRSNKNYWANLATVARISQLRDTDDTSLVAQRARITETLESVAVQVPPSIWYGNLRRLVTMSARARELHVIGVRDTDPHGKPGDAFPRVFLTKGCNRCDTRRTSGWRSSKACRSFRSVGDSEAYSTSALYNRAGMTDIIEAGNGTLARPQISHWAL